VEDEEVEVGEEEVEEEEVEVVVPSTGIAGVVGSNHLKPKFPVSIYYSWLRMCT